jgi:hypothetical protein
MVKLLMRFYDVDSRSIKVGTVDIREMKQTSLLPRLAWFCKIPATERPRNHYGNLDVPTSGCIGCQDSSRRPFHPPSRMAMYRDQ